MNVYKIVDEYSRTTGEKCGSRKVFDHSICDFTGLKIDEYENPNIYQIDFNDNDPCFGDVLWGRALGTVMVKDGFIN